MDLPWLDSVLRARRPIRLPVVLSRAEVRALLCQLHGVPRLTATLMYGSRLRLLECARLRVKDVDFTRRQITVRAGKGDKDRMTTLPMVIGAELARRIEAVKRPHDADLSHGAGWVELPWALARKYPHAGREGLAMGVPGYATPRRPRDTLCATRSRRSCWRTTVTSGRSRRCWATATSARPCPDGLWTMPIRGTVRYRAA